MSIEFGGLTWEAAFDLLDEARQRSTLVRRAGVAGHSILWDNVGTVAQDLRFKRFVATIAECVALEDACRAMIQQPVTYIDQLTRQRTVTVLDAMCRYHLAVDSRFDFRCTFSVLAVSRGLDGNEA